MSTLSARAVLGVNAPISQSLTLLRTLQKLGLGDLDLARGPDLSFVFLFVPPPPPPPVFLVVVGGLGAGVLSRVAGTDKLTRDISLSLSLSWCLKYFYLTSRSQSWIITFPFSHSELWWLRFLNLLLCLNSVAAWNMLASSDLTHIAGRLLLWSSTIWPTLSGRCGGWERRHSSGPVAAAASFLPACWLPVTWADTQPQPQPQPYMWPRLPLLLSDSLTQSHLCSYAALQYNPTLFHLHNRPPQSTIQTFKVCFTDINIDLGKKKRS